MAFQLISSFECVTKNCARAQLESLWGEEGFVKQTRWSKIFDPLALPKGQGYGSLQMTSWVRDQTEQTELASDARKAQFLSALFDQYLDTILCCCFKKLIHIFCEISVVTLGPFWSSRCQHIGLEKKLVAIMNC